MIQAKCIIKQRNKYGIIEKYTIQSESGETITVSPQQLKDAIRANKIEIINLQLTKDGKLMDKSIESTLREYKKLEDENVVIDKGQYSKAAMLGVAPILNDSGHVIGVNTQKVMFSDSTRMIGKNIINIDSSATFYGTLPLTKRLDYIGIKMKFKDILVLNHCIMSCIGADPKEIVITSEDIHIDHSYLDIKVVDEIFKILKSQKEHNTYGDLFKISFEYKKYNINKDEIYSRTEKIIKRQKVSSNNDRRAYDLMVYMQFIYSMYITTECSDKRYREIVQNIYKEYMRLASGIISMYGSRAGFADAVRNMHKYISRIEKDFNI